MDLGYDARSSLKQKTQQKFNHGYGSIVFDFICRMMRDEAAEREKHEGQRGSVAPEKGGFGKRENSNLGEF